MLIRCPNCNEECETEAEPMLGQHVLCPFCETKFSYAPQKSTVENAQEEMPQMAENRTEGSTIKIMCPYCGAGYEVDAGYEGEIATCGTCDKKFVMQVEEKEEPFLPSQLQNSSSAGEPKVVPIRDPEPVLKPVAKPVLKPVVKLGLGANPPQKKAGKALGGRFFSKMSKPFATAVERERNDKAQRNRSKAQGCLPAALFFLSWFFVAIFHNWASVAVSVACAFTAIMICVYNKLYAQMDGQTTINDIFKKLGIGGSSIFLIASTLVCTFLMHSCDRQAKEEEFESLKQAKERKARIERDGGWIHYQTCPNCKYNNVFWINKGEDPYRRQFQCESCRHWMKYKISIF